MMLLLFCLIAMKSFIAIDAAHTIEESNSSCSQPECLRCNLNTNECVKCLHVMMVGVRECRPQCPPGFDSIWVEDREVFGRVCQERSVLARVSQREVGIIAGASVVGAIFIGVFLGVLLLHKKGVKAPPDSPPRGLPRSLQDKRPKTAEVVIKGKERAEFLSRLRLLRTDAPHIFHMMAATRSRFRTSAAAGNDAPADAKSKACRAVVRDLSRVLCLLSLKEEHLQTAPKDWRCLLSWTERLLARYKRQEELKASGENAISCDLLDSTQTNSPKARTLFVTRQQQLKTEQEKRRRGTRTLAIDELTDKLDPPEMLSSPVTVNDKDIGQPLPINFLAPKPLETKTPSSGKITKMKELFNFHKNLWLKVTSVMGKKEEDLEKGKQDQKDNKDLSFQNLESLSFPAVEIPSQTFFDHIESFAFDLGDELEISPQATDTIDPNFTCSQNNKKNLLHRNNFSCANNKYKNNLNLYKNYKNNKLLCSERPFHGGYPSRKDGVCLPKESRPSRLRRLSSSLLHKDRKQLTVFKETKRRRPLKRQKQVEKDKHSRLLQKYQNSKVKNDPDTLTNQSDSQDVEGKRNSINNISTKDQQIVIPLPYKDTTESENGPHSNGIDVPEFFDFSVVTGFPKSIDGTGTKLIIPVMDCTHEIKL